MIGVMVSFLKEIVHDFYDIGNRQVELGFQIVKNWQFVVFFTSQFMILRSVTFCYIHGWGFSKFVTSHGISSFNFFGNYFIKKLRVLFGNNFEDALQNNYLVNNAKDKWLGEYFSDKITTFFGFLFILFVYGGGLLEASSKSVL